MGAPYSLRHKIRLIKQKGIKPFVPQEEIYDEDLNLRIEKLLNITKPETIKPENMLFLVMYDIEDNRVRKEIAKFLIKKGCIRIQKSVYVANVERKIYKEIKDALKDVQEMYDNHDSILIIPVASDEMRKMIIIGQQLDVELILGNRNTLFF